MKHREQHEIKVQPIHLITKNKAPYFYIPKMENELLKSTDERARVQSRLGQSKEWKFII